MRIAFISYEYPPETVGGIGTYTKQVATLLNNNNIDVHVFAGSHTLTSTKIENEISVHKIFCKGPDDFQNNVLDIFIKEHTSNPFHLIESAEIHANALAIKKAYPNLPLIVRLHASNWLVENLKKKYVPLQNKLRFFLGALRRGKWDLGYWRSYDYKNDPDYCFVKKADFITAPSMQMKNWAVEKWKIDDKRIKVLENPFLENEAFKSARTYNEEHTIIFFGRLNVLKGLITATKAMKHILKNNPSWRWIIIGADGTSADGKTSMKQWMENQLKALISQVTFHDTVAYEEIPFYLRKASIVLIPSLFESYSYVTIESMSAAKAIVGSKNTGIASLIENNVTGILVDANKSDKWINKIQELINNIALRKSIGKAAFAYVEKKHSVNAEIVGYYKEEIISNTLKY